MGIPGLTTFINNRSDRYLEYFELRDTYLVIDGNSISCQIYNSYKCNCVFGGDYDKYAQRISDFFDDLLKCNVVPLVLIDGGCEDKKLQTVISRTKEKILFKDIMRKKNIRHVQCLFEADNAIAAVARILNCPVLSYDSDFYVFGTLYIPFDTLDNYTVKSSTGTGYMKRCKIYKVEYLLNSYKGLNQSTLPLAAILLGNDYVKRGTFRNFFRYLKLRRITRKRYSNRQYCIEATLQWLSGYTLDKAVIGILCRSPKPIRQKILSIIETNINGYTNASAEILVPLGFSQEYAARATTHSINRIFKFDGDVNSLMYIEETDKNGDFESSEEEEEEENEVEILDMLKESESATNNALANVPKWFVDEFLMGNYPAYFMDLLVRRLYICPVQIEDYSYPSSNVISLKIIRVIYTFLQSGMNKRRGFMKYMMRSHNKKLKCYELEGIDTIFSSPLLSLSNLREVPLMIRREILNDTLEIRNIECIYALPPEWMLYIACAQYWIKQDELYKSDKCYMYSIFVCLLFNIIDIKIGKHRIIHNFQNKYGTKIQSIKQKRKTSNCKPDYSTHVTLDEACNNVDPDDCLMAAPFFISHFEMDRKLYTNPKKFNRSIIHAFAVFQNCLRHSMNLNALLGYPYTQIEIANLFNGTLLYNIVNNFKTRYDIEGYINTILENSPSLCRVFFTLLSTVTPLFASCLQNEVNSRKKQRPKSKHTKSDQNTDDNDTEYFSADEDTFESKFYDANNPFSLLNCTE
ncbi:single-strand DNA endonuclease protein asteroid [Colletes latitarsis]|uniref:single-strand DNA endonuclease protein asteroid n=1 Tax=Colletes latitarsis TaxID=2605962 RepID=UPI004036E0BC